LYSFPFFHFICEKKKMEVNTQHDCEIPSQDDMRMKVDEPVNRSVWCRLITKNSDSITYELTPIEPDSEGRYNLITIGRALQCHIKFDLSPRVSNRHCMIYCKMNRADPTNPYLEAWIEDTSANGTFLNRNQRLQKNVPRLLRTGDEISLVNPELTRISNVDISEETVQRNSFIVVLDLPNPQQHARSSAVTRRQEMLDNIQRGLVRSNTVIRLLGQHRNIYDYYDICELLGTGAAGHVYRGIKKDTGKEWAVKVIDTRKIAEQDISVVIKEAELLRSIHHPNVMRLEDIFAGENEMHLVMELSSGGDLFDRISSKRRYNETEAKQVMLYILDAIKCLHEFNIAHRDLKPENILLPFKHDDTWVKITDFGLAKVVDEKGTKTYCGTPQYFAPEVMERKYSVTKSGSYSLEADIWSCGCILYVILLGCFPFNGTSERALYHSIRNGRYNTQLPQFAALSVEAKDLLARLLDTDPSRRFTAAQALEHPWLASLYRQHRERGPSRQAEPGAEEGSTAASALMLPPAPIPGGRPHVAYETPQKKESVMSSLAEDITAMDVIDSQEPQQRQPRVVAKGTPSPSKRGGRRAGPIPPSVNHVYSSPAASTTTGKRKRSVNEIVDSDANNVSPPRAKRVTTNKK
jgi:serine/threonine protein kinase